MIYSTETTYVCQHRALKKLFEDKEITRNKMRQFISSHSVTLLELSDIRHNKARIVKRKNSASELVLKFFRRGK